MHCTEFYITQNMFQAFIHYTTCTVWPQNGYWYSGSIVQIAGFPMQQKLHTPQIQAVPCGLCSAENNNWVSDTELFLPRKMSKPRRVFSFSDSPVLLSGSAISIFLFIINICVLQTYVHIVYLYFISQNHLELDMYFTFYTTIFYFIF